MKYIIADLDGTLVHKEHISNQTLETIKYLQENNIFFSIATGRHIEAARHIIEQFNIKHPVICSNGGLIYDYQNEKLLYRNQIETDYVQKVIDICSSYTADFLLYTTKRIVSTKHANEHLKAKIGKYNGEIVELNELNQFFDEGIVKILVIEDDLSKLNEIKQKLSKLSEISYVQSQPFFIDIGHKGSSKGNALTHLAEILEFDLKDAITIGDQENDISMIEVAGIGVSMGNGTKDLKEKANFITAAFEDDGFSYAIRELLIK